MGFFDDRERENVGPPPDPFRIGGGGQFRSPIPLRWIGVAAGVLVLLVVVNVAKSIFVDWLWFDSVSGTDGSSYLGVFQTVVGWKVALFAVGATISAVVLGLNIWVARRLAPTGPEESFIEEVDPQAIRRIVMVGLVAATLLMAVIFGQAAGGAWETILLWRNGISFGAVDPQFNRDISFYLFDLPAYHLFQTWVMWLLIVSTLGAGAVYGLTLSLQGFELNITRAMRVHLSVLVGLVLLVIAGGTVLSIFDLATSATGIVAGATYADVNARLPVRYGLVVLGAAAGIVTIANAFLSQGYRAPIFFFGLWVFAGIVGGAIYPSFVQRYQVEPNELERERPFIERNITGTRLAFGLADMEELQFEAQPAVTPEEVAANPATIDNIRLLDARPLRDTFNELQALRPFYFFRDIDIDRYMIDGKPRQVMISARELDIRRTEGANWTRERLQLTHGYGAVIAPVNEVTEEGQPNLMTSDIPPQGDVIPIATETAQIYFGELTTHYVIVKTDEPEFDYPLGESFASTFYEPDRGIRLSSFVRRVALAWQLGDTNLLISGQLSSGSRLLMNRSLDQRIEKLAPFLTLDADPYVVVDQGRMFWIQDAYTTSGSFPYSQPRGGVNYIRNSVKITVDAITGDTTFYLVDETDPIALTWKEILPDLFTPADEMPDVVRAHLRYPQDMFRLQAELYLRYHIRQADVFFIGEDLWSVPFERFRQQEQEVEPYYVIMTLPGEQQEEFALILPFTPAGKRNTIAWLAGREPAPGEFLGTLRAYRFPTDRLIFGPAQIEALIDADTTISPQLTLWDQSGSEVIRGNLLMIPIGSSFLFIEPIYLQASASKFPVLERVVVVNGNEQEFTIAMEETFAIALDVVLQRSTVVSGDGAQPPPSTAPPGPTATPVPGASGATFADLISSAQEAYDAAQRELARLREILDALSQQQQGQ